RVVQRRGLELVDHATGEVEVAEDDRLGRAGRLAGGDDLHVGDAPVLVRGLDAGLGDALRAVRALLHHAAAAHGHVGVVRQRQRRRGRVELRVLQVVETPDLVGAVVRAVARADAAVVDHHVQALGVVDRRAHRAHRLAGRLLALLARHGLGEERGVVDGAAVVVVDAQPVHLAVPGHLLLAHDRDVVLGLAGHDAGAAPRADRLVDDHPPLVALVLEVGVQVGRVVLDRVHETGVVGVGPELGERAGADDVPALAGALERVVLLRYDEAVAPAGPRHAHGRPERCLGRAHDVGVHAHAVAHVPGSGASVAEREGDRAVGLPRLHQHWRFDGPVADGQGHDVVGVHP